MAGFVMLTDTNPQEPENLVNQVAPKVCVAVAESCTQELTSLLLSGGPTRCGR